MAIATSAGLIGFFAIPPIMADAAMDSPEFYPRFTISLWLTSIVSAFSLVCFIIFSIPLVMYDRKLKKAEDKMIKKEEEEEDDFDILMMVKEGITENLGRETEAGSVNSDAKTEIVKQEPFEMLSSW